MSQSLQTTENVMDELVIKLLDKKSIKKPLFDNTPAKNQGYKPKIDNTAKLLINQIKFLEQKLYSLSLEVNTAKEQLNEMLNKQGTKENAEHYIRLMSYLHKLLSEGTPKETIKQELISKGWQEEVIDKVFNIISPVEPTL